MRTVAEIEQEIEAVQKELADVHGEPTEVYARIVGYYRSVRNWNKGKKSEYAQRKQFSVPKDFFSLQEKSGAPQNETAKPSQKSAEKNTPQTTITSYELFTRATCPKCPTVKHYMDFSGLEGTNISVDSEEGLAVAAAKGVLATPTVIFYDHAQKEVARAHNVPELEEIVQPVHIAIA